MRFRAIFGALFVCLATAGSAVAQTITGEIVGRVTDASDAVLPGVTITVTGPSLLQPLTTTSSEAGSFRFSQVPIGTYSLKFELGGFNSAVRSNIQISSGFTAQVVVALAVSGVEEVVMVSSEPPVIDTTKTGSTSTFSREVLDAIPTSRDPWSMMEQTPSIVMDRANVGGSQSGQQSGFVVRGAGTGNNVWSLDGVNVTDMSATGATTMYYNFDGFEQIQYNIGGNDVTIATGGMGINLITKSGSDKLRGSGRYLITDNELQDDNITDELRNQGASAGNPIQRNLDYGIEGGGPIMKGRVWFWGAASRTDVKVGVNNFFKPISGCPANTAAGRTQARSLDTETLRSCLQTDQTLLKNYTFKFTGRTFNGNRLEWFSDWADKFRNARAASPTRPPETVEVQTGPVWTHKINDQQVFTDRWLGEFQYAFVGGGFKLDMPNPEEQFGVQRYFDEVTGEFRRAHSQQLFDRPLYLFDARTSYFLPGALGGDHSFKFGYAFRHAPVTSYGHVAGFLEARFRSGVAANAAFHRDSFTSYLGETHSFYAQDEYHAGRFTARLGLRWDRYTDVTTASATEANPFVPNLLPALQFGGADPGVAWSNWSPRFGLNYDVFGTGRTIAGLTLSRYYGQAGIDDISGILNPVAAVNLRYPWTDTNNDQFVQLNEVNFNATPVITGNYNPASPGSPTTINTVDPNLKNDTTDEVIVGLQHELFPGIALTANYIYRKYDNFRWDVSEGITSDVYRQVTTTPTGCFSAPNVAAACPTITYFEPTINIGGLKRIRTNQPDRYRDYNGFELALTKRYSNRWYANVSYAYNSSVDNYDSARAFTDPTNIDVLNGFQWAQESGGSGVSDVWVNAKWVARATAIYTLPWNISVSGFLNGHQGYIFPSAYTTANRPNGAGTATVVIEPYGEARHPNFWQFDFKVERPIRLKAVTFRPQATVFNVSNSSVVLARERNIGGATYGEIRQILSPRIIQVGVRVDF